MMCFLIGHLAGPRLNFSGDPTCFLAVFKTFRDVHVGIQSLAKSLPKTMLPCIILVIEIVQTSIMIATNTSVSEERRKHHVLEHKHSTVHGPLLTY